MTDPRYDTASTGNFDLFVASPMSPLGARDYHENRESLIGLVGAVMSVFGFRKVFCPAISIETKEVFSSSYDSALEDLRALRSSSHFLLHFINAVKSSAIFEAGIAYELRLPSVYVVRARADLPYLLRELEELERKANGDQACVRIVEVGEAGQSLDSIVSREWYGVGDAYEGVR